MNRIALALFLSLSLSGVARAQEDDAKKAQVLEEARQHVARAKVHYDLGEYKEAAEEYTLVYRLRPIPALLFNIAQAYRQAGVYDKAKQFYKSYLRESPDVKNRAMIEQSIREMDELLAKERRTREAPPSGVKEPAEATLPIKSAVAAETPKPAETPKVESKPVTPPKPAETKPVAAAPTSTVTPAPPKPPVTVAIAPTSQSPATRQPIGAFGTTPPPPPATKSHTLTWVAAAGSALALGGGAVFGYKTYDAGSNSDASKANILYGVGAALAIASATFFVLDF